MEAIAHITQNFSKKVKHVKFISYSTISFNFNEKIIKKTSTTLHNCLPSKNCQKEIIVSPLMYNESKNKTKFLLNLFTVFCRFLLLLKKKTFVSVS